jgi:NADPH:quinone reductase
MKKMKTLRFKTYGSPSVLFMEDVDVPLPAHAEVLIEVHASGVNPSDVKAVAGRFKSALPRTPGRDFAGVVMSGSAEIGKQVWGSGAGLELAGTAVMRNTRGCQLAGLPRNPRSFL